MVHISRVLTRAAIGCVVALMPLMMSGPALANCRARFSCGFGSSPYCYFVIRSYGHDKYFRVQAGSSTTMYGIERTSRYCTSTRGYPDGDECRQSPVNMNCY